MENHHRFIGRTICEVLEEYKFANMICVIGRDGTDIFDDAFPNFRKAYEYAINHLKYTRISAVKYHSKYPYYDDNDDMEGPAIEFRIRFD